MHEDLDPLLLVILEDKVPPQVGDADDGEDQKEDHLLQAQEDEEGEQNEGVGDGGAHVRLGHDQQDRSPRDGPQTQDVLEGESLGIVVSKDSGDQEYHDDLAEFGGLDPHSPDSHPCLGSRDSGGKDEKEEEGEEEEAVEVGGEGDQPVGVDAGDQHEEDQTQEEEEGLFLVVGGVVGGVDGVEHQQADEEIINVPERRSS